MYRLRSSTVKIRSQVCCDAKDARACGETLQKQARAAGRARTVCPQAAGSRRGRLRAAAVACQEGDDRDGAHHPPSRPREEHQRQGYGAWLALCVGKKTRVRSRGLLPLSVVRVAARRTTEKELKKVEQIWSLVWQIPHTQLCLTSPL